METMSNDTILDIQPGTKLSNGATVLLVGGKRPGGGGTVPTVIVLAYSMTEYVTWEVSLIDGSAFWGHYFGGASVDAAGDFIKRVAKVTA